MSFKNLAWASEQSQISPNAKLMAIFIASQADVFGRSKFSLEDAAAWCCFRHDGTAERLTYELANTCGLSILKRDPDHDVVSFEVLVPSAKNGGELL